MHIDAPSFKEADAKNNCSITRVQCASFAKYIRKNFADANAHTHTHTHF